MAQKLREILLTHYIGSILVALLCWEAVIVVIQNVLRAVFWVVNDQRTHSAFETSHPSFPWDNIVFSAVTVALYVLVAYWLARWLYPANSPLLPQPASNIEPPVEVSEQS
jgi:hypothetical protein